MGINYSSGEFVVYGPDNEDGTKGPEVGTATNGTLKLTTPLETWDIENSKIINNATGLVVATIIDGVAKDGSRLMWVFRRA